GKVRWQDIAALHSLQEKEGLRAANKLTKGHIQFENRKMNVKLAAQTLSRSVASGLRFAEESNSLMDCSGTIEFCEIIDHLFDVFNSRSPLARGFKHPLNATNWAETKIFLRRARYYLMTICDQSGKRIVEGKRRMGILGFVFNIDS
ncbi:hypothetical protein CAPTEDRAFT_39725, partial [Capitella teleta]